jgi:hypothetical protein
MKLKQVVAGAAISCALGMTGISLGSGVAGAAPPQCNPAPGVQCGPGGPGGPPAQRGPGGPPPEQRGPDGPPQGDFRGPGSLPPGDFHDRGGPGSPPPGDFHNPGGPDFHTPDNHDWRPPWNPGDNDWRGRFHGAPWGGDLPPWGWGAPPPPAWDGPLPDPWGPPPPPINYWGFQEQPVWDQGYNQWGFWFFGIWIPLPV